MRSQALMGRGRYILDFDRTLLPPAFQVVPSKPVDAFFEGTQGLQEDVDKLAKETPG